MSNDDIRDVLTDTLDVLKHDIAILERSQYKLGKSQTKLYWMNIKMSNNAECFETQEIKKGEILFEKLLELERTHNDVQGKIKELITDMEEIIQKINRCEEENLMEREQRMEAILMLMNTCLDRAQNYVKMQDDVRNDMEILENSIRNRISNSKRYGKNKVVQACLNCFKGKKYAK
ncbi:MAG: hypothetical protein PUJ55_03520 [Clostridiales bacterium]|nr:hypothetical protein [Roseburia sp.]MDD7635989.1 hypothetical protein [Clostridiales bacterium]MDY4114127.1 hypothetical protein [Roseburia sp.]